MYFGVQFITVYSSFQSWSTGYVHQPSGQHAMISLPQLRISTNEIDLGILKEGNTGQASFILSNVGINSCRFRVQQLHPTEGVKVYYTPGQVNT